MKVSRDIMNDPLVNKYRKSFRGRNCRFCKYYKYVSSRVISAPDYEECILRDMVICHTFKAKFCKYYRVGEEQDEK